MSQDYDQHLILHHLDDPFRILYWTLDEAIVIFVPTIAGIFLNQVMLGFIFSVSGFWGLRKTKKVYGFDNVKHMFYWYLPRIKKKLPNSPDSHIREYLG